MLGDLGRREPLFHDAGGRPHDKGVGRYILGHQGPSGNDRTSAYGHPGQHDGAVTYPHVVLHDNHARIPARPLEHGSAGNVGAMGIPGDQADVRGEHHVVAKDHIRVKDAEVAYAHVVAEPADMLR